MSEINRKCVKYISGTIILSGVLSLLMYIAAIIGWVTDWMLPVAVSVAFSLVMELADVLVWRMVSLKAPNFLTTFYSSVSGFRMLLALAALFVCYFLVDEEKMMTLVVVFLIYYAVMLVHHAIFFAREANAKTGK